MRRRTLLGAAILAACLSCGSAASADPALVDLQVVDRATGQALPFWRQHGRLFVAGQPGARYGLRVSNHTGGRVLLVLSVDGVNVLTGETAKYDQRGYVLDPYDSYDVNGWRKSESEVAAFTFAPLHDSYAGRTGRPGDVGVVGMAVFRERQAAPPAYDAAARDRFEPPASKRGAGPPPALTPAPSAQARSAPAEASSIAGEASAKSSLARRTDEKLGTGHGAREWSSVTMVEFVRSTSYPLSIRQIEYDTAPHLIARGVTPPWDDAAVERHPRPFPREARPGFVPDPPGDR